MVSVTLVEDTGIPVADAGPNALINCKNNTVQVGGNSATGPMITYAWSSPDGGVIDTDPTSATITVSVGGTYNITVTDNENGCTAVDQVNVTEDFSQPTGILSVASIIDCDNSTTTISVLADPPGSYTYMWSTIDGQIVSGNGTAAIVAGRSGTYSLLLTSLANGCSDLVSVQVFADPEVIAGLDVVLNPPECPEDADGSIHLIEVINGMPPYTYAWSTLDSGTILQLLTPGDYTITVTDARGCTYSETYSFPEPIEMNPDIGIDLMHEPGDSVNIIVTVQDIHAIATVIWGGVAPPCPGCFEITFPAHHSGEVQVTTIDTNGCTATDFLYLTVDINRNVFIPNIFSPNGDFVNDKFRIDGKMLKHIEYLKIYDRWGDLVYLVTNTAPDGYEGWDGTLKGRPLQPAVFVYSTMVEHTDGTRELITGTVTLLR
jgi:gliding motility-associated-like protein